MPPLDLSRTLRERSKLGNTYAPRHSPDGYFANDEVLLRNWRPLTGLASTVRSKGHLAEGDMLLQDVQEEDSATATATAADRAYRNPWRRPSQHDSRSPCPALNAAANHGYLPRDGRNLSMWTIIRAIRDCYNVSWVLAFAFTVGSFIILRWAGVGRGWLWPRIDLEDLATHNILEHNSSLTHWDYGEQDGSSPRSRSLSVSSSSSTAISTHTHPSSPSFQLPFPLSLIPIHLFFHSSPKPRNPHAHMAPLTPSRTLIRALLADSASGTHLTLPDVARARIRRTATTGPCPPHLSHISDAECALAVAVLGGDVYSDSPRVPLAVLREWLEDERLPAGWAPGGEMGLWREHVNTAKVQKLMANMRMYRAKRDDVRTVVIE